MKLFAIIFAAIIAAFACIAWFASVVEQRAAHERTMIGYAEEMQNTAGRHFSGARSLEDIPAKISLISDIRASLVRLNKGETKPRIADARQRAIDACDRYIAELKQLQATYRR